MDVIRLSPEKAEELKKRLDIYRAENPGFNERFPSLSFSKPGNYYGATSDVTIPEGLTRQEFNAAFIESFDPETAAATRRRTLESKAFGVKLETGLTPHQNAVELADLESWRLGFGLDKSRTGNTLTVTDPHNAANKLVVDIVPDSKNPLLVSYRMKAELDPHTGEGFKRQVEGFASELGLSFKNGTQSRSGGYSYEAERTISTDAEWIKLNNKVTETRTTLYEADRTYRQVMKDAVQGAAGGDAKRSAVASQIMEGIKAPGEMEAKIPAVKPGQPDPLDKYYTARERSGLHDVYKDPEFGKSSPRGFMLEIRAESIRTAVFERQIMAVETSRFQTLADHMVTKGEISANQARELTDDFRAERGQKAAVALDEKIQALKKEKPSISLSSDDLAKMQDEFKGLLAQTLKPSSKHGGAAEAMAARPAAAEPAVNKGSSVESAHAPHEASVKGAGNVSPEAAHGHGKIKATKYLGLATGAVAATQALLAGQTAQAATIAEQTVVGQVPVVGGVASEVIGEGRRDELVLSGIQGGMEVAGLALAPWTLGLSIPGSIVAADLTRMGANLMGYNVDPSLIQTVGSLFDKRSDIAADSTTMVLAMAYMNDMNTPEKFSAYKQAQEKANQVLAAKNPAEKTQLASDFLLEARVKISQDVMKFVDKHYSKFPLEKLGVHSKAELAEMLMDKEGYRKIDKYSNAFLREALHGEGHNIRDAMHMANNTHAHLVQSAAAQGINIQFGQKPQEPVSDMAYKDRSASAPVATAGTPIGPG